APGPACHPGPSLPRPAALERFAYPGRGPGRLAPLPRLPRGPLPQSSPAVGRPAPGYPLGPAGQTRPAHPRPRRPPRRLAHPARRGYFLRRPGAGPEPADRPRLPAAAAGGQLTAPGGRPTASLAAVAAAP